MKEWGVCIFKLYKGLESPISQFSSQYIRSEHFYCVTIVDTNWLLHHIFTCLLQVFGKCYIGGTPDMENDTMFCGQISSVYLFSEALLPGHVASMYALGPAYKVAHGINTKIRCESRLKWDQSSGSCHAPIIGNSLHWDQSAIVRI